MTHATAPAHRSGFDTAKLQRPLVIAATLLVAANGLLHLKIWNSDYRNLPSQVPGQWVVKVGFPVNAALAVVLAVALVVLIRQRLVPVAAALFTAGSLAALILSRSSVGIFGWKENGWTSNAKMSAVIEVLGLVVLASVIVLRNTNMFSTTSQRPERTA